jgi:hypothetical protein
VCVCVCECVCVCVSVCLFVFVCVFACSWRLMSNILLRSHPQHLLTPYPFSAIAEAIGHLQLHSSCCSAMMPVPATTSLQCDAASQPVA